MKRTKFYYYSYCYIFVILTISNKRTVYNTRVLISPIINNTAISPRRVVIQIKHNVRRNDRREREKDSRTTRGYCFLRNRVRSARPRRQPRIIETNVSFKSIEFLRLGEEGRTIRWNFSSIDGAGVAPCQIASRYPLGAPHPLSASISEMYPGEPRLGPGYVEPSNVERILCL